MKLYRVILFIIFSSCVITTFTEQIVRKVTEQPAFEIDGPE